MNINDFYVLSSKLSLSTIQVHPVNIKKEDDTTLSDAHKLILGNYLGISFPIIFKQEYGKKFEDILDTGWPSLYLISERMKNILEENQLTGWKSYDARVLDKNGNKINGYYGLSITGRCGGVDYQKSEIIEKRLIPTGPLVKYYKGLHIGLDQWDSSDFFLPEKYFGIIINRKTAELIKKNKLTNIKLENLSEIEMDEYIIRVASPPVDRRL